VRLHAHSYGNPSGPPIVCVHGVTGHGERFRRLAEERLTGFHVLAVDLRGHGRSGYEPPWNLETHVDDLLETAPDRAIWVGFSLGGRLVAELARAHPERVERLVLLDPALQLPVTLAYESAEEECRDTSFASPDEAIQARYDSGSVISTPRELLEEEMRQHLVQGEDGRYRFRYSKPAVIAAWGEMTRTPVPVANVPTLMVLGTESYVPSNQHPERYRDALGDSFQVVGVDSGHSVLWDAFDETADCVCNYLT
jgi:lipase